MRALDFIQTHMLLTAYIILLLLYAMMTLIYIKSKNSDETERIEILMKGLIFAIIGFLLNVWAEIIPKGGGVNNNTLRAAFIWLIACLVYLISSIHVVVYILERRPK